MREIEIKKNWHYLYICIGDGHWTRKPMISIGNYRFDFLWLGFQITWRYFGNFKESITGLKVKDYDKVLSTIGDNR